MNIFWLILGMSIVTALPRLLPALLPGRWQLPRWLEQWLAAIPYAALGALIFPGVWQLDSSRPWLGLAGAVAAFASAAKGLPLGITLAVSIGVVFALSL